MQGGGGSGQEPRGSGMIYNLDEVALTGEAVRTRGQAGLGKEAEVQTGSQEI